MDFLGYLSAFATADAHTGDACHFPLFHRTELIIGIYRIFWLCLYNIFNNDIYDLIFLVINEVFRFSVENFNLQSDTNSVIFQRKTICEAQRSNSMKIERPKVISEKNLHRGFPYHSLFYPNVLLLACMFFSSLHRIEIHLFETCDICTIFKKFKFISELALRCNSLRNKFVLHHLLFSFSEKSIFPKRKR